MTKVSDPFRIASYVPRNTPDDCNPKLREGWEGTGEENSGWTITEGPNGAIDTDAVPPGSPSWAGTQCMSHVKTADNEDLCASRAIADSSEDQYVHHAFRLNAASASVSVLAGYDATPQPQWQLLYTGGNLQYKRRTAGGFASAGSVACSLKKWHDIRVVEKASGAWEYWFDGALVASGTTALTTPATTLYLGAYAATTDTWTLYSGPLEIRTDRAPAPFGESAVVLRESFEGTGYENAWSEQGPGGTSVLDEDYATPAGTPAELGDQCLRYLHVDGDEQCYPYTSVSALPRGFLRAYIKPLAFPYSRRFVYLYGSGAAAGWYHDGTQLAFNRYVGASWVDTEVAAALNEWHCVEFAWDRVAGWTSGRLNGELVYHSQETIDSDISTMLIGTQGTSTTIEFLIDAIEIRTDTWPGMLPEFEEDEFPVPLLNRNRRLLVA